MSLLKLWNAIRGRGGDAPATAATSPPTQTAEPQLVSPATTGKNPERTSPAKTARSKAGLFSMPTRGPHGGLCKLIKKRVTAGEAALRVLEIGVDDGQRSQAVLKTLLAIKPTESVHYSAVDTFEMGDGPIALKDFNRQLRALGVKPQLVPMPTTAGLTRLAHTLGQVDLVLDSQGFHRSDDSPRLLSKLSHPGTLWLAAQDDDWIQIDVSGSANDRRAA